MWVAKVELFFPDVVHPGDLSEVDLFGWHGAVVEVPVFILRGFPQVEDVLIERNTIFHEEGTDVLDVRGQPTGSQADFPTGAWDGR